MKTAEDAKDAEDDFGHSEEMHRSFARAYSLHSIRDLYPFTMKTAEDVKDAEDDFGHSQR